MGVDPDASLAELVELRRKYKADCASVEAQVQALKRELAAQKDKLTAEYVAKLANAIAERLKPILTEVLREDE